MESNNIIMIFLIAGITICLLSLSAFVFFYIKKISETMQNNLNNANIAFSNSLDKTLSSIEATKEKMISFESSVKEKLNFVQNGLESVQKKSNDSNELLKMNGKDIEGVKGSISNLDSLIGNKQARGAFGERSLDDILENSALSKQSYEKQYLLPNGTRADFAIKYNGIVLCVDSKFPFESFSEISKSKTDDPKLIKKFENDIKKHIDAISSKYIIEEETMPTAIMFIPSDEIFLEVCKNSYTILDYASSKNVLFASPNTVISNIAVASSIRGAYLQSKNFSKTQKEISTIINDLSRFKIRYDSMSKIISSLVEEENNLSITVEKILKRSEKISKLQIDEVD